MGGQPVPGLGPVWSVLVGEIGTQFLEKSDGAGAVGPLFFGKVPVARTPQAVPIQRGGISGAAFRRVECGLESRGGAVRRFRIVCLQQRHPQEKFRVGLFRRRCGDFDRAVGQG